MKAQPEGIVHLFARAFDPSDPIFKRSNPVPWATARSRRELMKPDRVITLRLADAGRAGSISTEGRKQHIGYSIVDAIPVFRDDANWNGEWSGKARLTPDALSAEMAIPWRVMEGAGLRREKLQVEVGHAVRWGGRQDDLLRGFDRSAIQIQMLDNPPGGSKYDLKLHFAELDDAAPGERVFDVVLQGQLVLKDFDVAKEAGGRLRAISRQFTVTAERQLDLRFVPKGSQAERSAPILNGLEIIAR